MDTLDYTGPKVNEGSKGVLLGLGDAGARAAARVPAAALPPPEATAAAVFCARLPRRRRPGVRRRTGSRAARLAADPAFAGWPLVVLADDAAARRRDERAFLWTALHALRARGRHPRGRSRVVRNHLAFRRPS